VILILSAIFNSLILDKLGILDFGPAVALYLVVIGIDFLFHK
jgi:hypothetical protein